MTTLVLVMFIQEIKPTMASPSIYIHTHQLKFMYHKIYTNKKPNNHYLELVLA